MARARTRTAAGPALAPACAVSLPASPAGRRSSRKKSPDTPGHPTRVHSEAMPPHATARDGSIRPFHPLPGLANDVTSADFAIDVGLGARASPQFNRLIRVCDSTN
eukprot:6187657-Pleurochrysis_carterae.AAC.2